MKNGINKKSLQSILCLQLLIDAIARGELSQVILLLADSTPEDVSAYYSNNDKRTALHIAAQKKNAIFVQLLLWVSFYLCLLHLILSYFAE